MVGKGLECGRSFEEFVEIIVGVIYNEYFFVCFDICYMYDVGYDVVNDFDGVFNEFDKIVGIDWIKVFYVNDSKNIRGVWKDCYENIGFGEIGFNVLQYIVYYEQLVEILKIFEILYVGEDKKNKKLLYCFEIEMLKEK